MFNLCFSDYLRGTQFTFKNGYTVSVQWGAVNYCSNHRTSLLNYEDCRTCPDAEIAVFDPAGNFVPLSATASPMKWTMWLPMWLLTGWRM